MKKIWNVISVISLANLLAMAGFLGWLVKTDRLDMDRIRQARVALATTVSQEKADADQAKGKQEEEQKAAEAEAAAGRPPLTAAERLAARVQATELDIQRAERLKREVQDMQRQLGEERARFDKDKQQLADDRKAFEEMVASSTASTSDAQFQKTLSVMQSLKPAQAVSMLMEMMNDPALASDAPAAPAPGPVVGGTGAIAAPQGKNYSRAVSYLDAMDEKHCAAVIKELAKSDPKLAAELLERIRKRGQFAPVP